MDSRPIQSRRLPNNLFLKGEELFTHNGLRNDDVLCLLLILRINHRNGYHVYNFAYAAT
jgi:hypothetical protein